MLCRLAGETSVSDGELARGRQGREGREDQVRGAWVGGARLHLLLWIGQPPVSAGEV